jgi:hypothetical protein
MGIDTNRASELEFKKKNNLFRIFRPARDCEILNCRLVT